jgi:2,4-dienoyl-CoA reductase-like NADH-dependent reductase (Old Yellow Enzyme family)
MVLVARMPDERHIGGMTNDCHDDLLFHPLRAGALTLANRVVMAPLTRCRAVGGGRVPNRLMADYYAQRASFGMILSEATAIGPMGLGYPDTPGIWTDAQVAGWRVVTDAVHAAGGLIACQLWHVGRISDPHYLGGRRPVAPSAIAAAGNVSHLRPVRPFPVPRALDAEQIPGIIEEYRAAGRRALEAGFDAVQLHGANGYLVDQFLHLASNRRDDGHGGPVERRAAFLFEVLEALCGECGAGRVGVHLSPRPQPDEDVSVLWEHVGRGLEGLGVAFVCAREPRGGEREAGALGPLIRKHYGGVFIINESLDGGVARDLVAGGMADAAAFGRAAIANPDLPARLAANAPLNEPDAATFYGAGAEGYTDYPFLSGI